MYGTDESPTSSEKERFNALLVEALKENLRIEIDRYSESNSYGRRSYTTQVEVLFSGEVITKYTFHT